MSGNIIKISELPVGGTPTGDEIAPFVQSGETVSLSINAIVAAKNFREVLTTDRTYYVRTDGSNSNDGLTDTATGAFATIQYAWTYLSQNIDGGGHFITISVGAGTWGIPAGNTTSVLSAENANVGPPGASYIAISGAGSSSTIIDPATNGAIYGFRFLNTLTPVFVDHLKFQNSIGTANTALYANGPTNIFGLNDVDVDFGSGWTNHITSTNGALFESFGIGYKISGSAASHLVSDGGNFDLEQGVVTLTGTPNFSRAFMVATGPFNIYDNMTFSGSATGKRFLGENGTTFTILNADYSYNNDLTYLPGNAAGTTDGTCVYNSKILGTREVLTADRTYYVRTDGSDSNDGLSNTAAGAFLTFAGCWNAICAGIDFGGKIVTISMQNTTWTTSCAFNTANVGGGAVTLEMNGATISTTGDHCIQFNALLSAAYITVRNYTLTTTANGHGVTDTAGNIVYTDGTNTYGPITAGYGAIASLGGGQIWFTDTVGTTSTNCNFFLYAAAGSKVYVYPASFVLTGVPAYARAFVLADSLSYIETFNFSGVTTGTCTGKRYEASLNSVIQTFAGGVNQFPGSIAGTTGTGGQYG